MATTFKYPLEDDIQKFADDIRDCDREEIAVHVPLLSVVDALRASVECSEFVQIAYVDDKPVVIFGVNRLDASCGSVWLMATNEIDNVNREFIRQSKVKLDEMFDKTGCESLKNIVLVKNDLHVRWLKWLGFDFGSLVVYNGHEFLQISKNKKS